MYSQKEDFDVKNTSPVHKGKLDIPPKMTIIITMLSPSVIQSKLTIY